VFWYCAISSTIGFSVGMVIGAWLRYYNPKRNSADIVDSWWLIPLRRYIVWYHGKDGFANVRVEKGNRQGSR